MRYTVGTTIPFISLSFNAHNGTPEGYSAQIGGGSTYYPWSDKLTEMSITLLTCEQHVKVPNEWDTEEKLDNDCFIFTNSTGAHKWNNQYPRAAYGQMSTEADYNVDRQDGDNWLRMMDAAHYLQNVYRGVSQLAETTETAHHDALLSHYAAVVDLLKASNITVVLKPYKIGDRVLKNWFKVTFD